MPSTGGGQGSAIKAGSAFVELFANDSKLVKALELAKKRVAQFGRFMTVSGAGVAGAGASIVAPIAKFFSDAVSRGATIQGIAARFNTTTESVSGLAAGFEKAGVGIEEFGGILDGIATKVRGLQNTDELIDGLRGVRGSDLIGKDVGTQLDLIAEKFKTITGAEEQLAVANELGLGGILPYLKKGKAGIDELRQAGADLGGVINAEQAAQSKEIMAAYTQVWQSLKYVFLEVGNALLPTSGQIKSTAKIIAEGTSTVRDFIKANKTLVLVVVAVGIALVVAGAAMIGIGLAASAVVSGVTALLTILSAVGTVAGIVFGPVTGTVLLVVAAIALAAAALVGLGYLFVTETEIGKEMWEALGKAAGEFAAIAKETWGGVVDAIGSGNLKLAGEIAFAGLKVAWAKIVLYMTMAWGEFKSTFLDIFGDAAAGVKILFKEIFDYIADGLEAAGLQDLADKLRLGDVVGDREATKAKNRESRANDTAEAAKDLADAAAELAGLTAQARAEAESKKTAAGKIAGGAGAARIVLGDSVKGIFGGGNVAMQLGYGDGVAKRQLDAAQGTEKNTSVLPELSKQVGDLSKGLSFK